MQSLKYELPAAESPCGLSKVNVINIRGSLRSQTSDDNEENRAKHAIQETQNFYLTTQNHSKLSQELQGVVKPQTRSTLFELDSLKFRVPTSAVNHLGSLFDGSQDDQTYGSLDFAQHKELGPERQCPVVITEPCSSGDGTGYATPTIPVSVVLHDIPAKSAEAGRTELESDTFSLSGSTVLDSASSIGLDDHNVSEQSTPDTKACDSPKSFINRSRGLRPSQLRGVYNKISHPCMSGFDRFIPHRETPGLSRERLLAAKSLIKLSAVDKSNRRRVRISDPFISHRARSVSIQPQTHHPLNRPNAGPLTPTQLSRDRGSIGSTVQSLSLSNLWQTTGLRGFSPGDVRRSVDEAIRYRTSVMSAPRYVSRFMQGSTEDEERDLYNSRIALALDLDQSSDVIRCVKSQSSSLRNDRSFRFLSRSCEGEIEWRDNRWIKFGEYHVLEAPNLRDDFYCSILAYSNTAKVLAVGLGEKLYLWREGRGVSSPPSQADIRTTRSGYITSVSFSSELGARAILAIARGDGRVTLYSPLDREPRFLKLILSTAAACVSFRPKPFLRTSQRNSAFQAKNEILLVGDESGMISFYSIEWPSENERYLFGWDGGIQLQARIKVHEQQICGIAWSADGGMFASGGNDNLCCLFEAGALVSVGRADQSTDPDGLSANSGNALAARYPANRSTLTGKRIIPKHQWRLTAAVKALAFCPWQKGLVALGGGSNDRCIHFFHTVSSAPLATIDCAAQVTALIWSTTKREVAATFGFAQPEHPYRIAVYSWPSCQQVIAIPWFNEMRALCAISYPHGPPRGGSKWSGEKGKGPGCRTREEGCIIVAASDGSIKFQEIWYGQKGSVALKAGVFGGSSILEGLHGIEDDAKETIR